MERRRRGGTSVGDSVGNRTGGLGALLCYATQNNSHRIRYTTRIILFACLELHPSLPVLENVNEKPDDSVVRLFI
jgi:hypothetical protein